MGRKALTDQKHEAIMAHILDPENSPLAPELKEQLDRVVSMSKLLDKYPTIKQAVEIHKSQHKSISNATAYRDVDLARRVYNSLHKFDYDFWKSWLINDIVKNIQRCENKGGDSYQYRRVIAMEHANLLKAIGEKPEELPDPERNLKHNFYLVINLDGKQVKVNYDQLQDLPAEAVREVNKFLIGGREIDDQGVAEILET